MRLFWYWLAGLFVISGVISAIVGLMGYLPETSNASAPRHVFPIPHATGTTGPPIPGFTSTPTAPPVRPPASRTATPTALPSRAPFIPSTPTLPATVTSPAPSPTQGSSGPSPSSSASPTPPQSTPPVTTEPPTPTPTPTTPTTPTVTPTSQNHANGLQCFVFVKVDHGHVIKRPCKE